LGRGPSGGQPLGVAHRGASKESPENTLAAFRLALHLGAEAVECDARRTRDRHVVVIHDHALDRTTDGRGPVESHTLSEIRGLDAGRWFGPQFAGARIPRLATGILYSGRLVDAPHAAQAAGADALCVHRGYVSPRDVARAHAAGLGFFVWTVDDEETLRHCVAWEVDGVTSNDTRLMLRV